MEAIVFEVSNNNAKECIEFLHNHQQCVTLYWCSRCYLLI